MKIFVVRHGETDWNKIGIVQGQTDIPLNDVGKQQARETGQELRIKKFDAIYCSPLLRARQTLKNLGVTSDKIVFDDRLKERNFGEFEKKPWDSFDSNLFWNYAANKEYQKAECVQDFIERVVNFIEDIKVKESKSENILVVTHLGVTKAFKRYFDGLKDDEIGPYLPSNASVMTYEV